jgi:hypothetical protein
MDYARAIFINMENDTMLKNARRLSEWAYVLSFPGRIRKSSENRLIRYALRGRERIWLSGPGGIGSS